MSEDCFFFSLGKDMKRLLDFSVECLSLFRSMLPTHTTLKNIFIKIKKIRIDV